MAKIRKQKTAFHFVIGTNSPELNLYRNVVASTAKKMLSGYSKFEKKLFAFIRIVPRTRHSFAYKPDSLNL